MKEKIRKIEKLITEDLCYLVILDKRTVNDSSINFGGINNKSIRDFLWLKNNYEYVMFGDFIFWVDEDDYLEHQSDIIEYGIQNYDDYICIGECDPYPILINKDSGNVLYVNNEVGDPAEYKEYGHFDDFIDKYVLGKKYLSIGSISEWNDFLVKNNIM